MRSRFIGNIVLVVVSMTVGLLLMEVGLRAYHWMKFGTSQTFAGGHFAVDPALGLRVPVAGLRTYSVAINSRGFRGPEIALPKPPATIRLAFLGGSTTFGSEASSNEHTWPHVLCSLLSRFAPGVHFDYVNAAVPGYTTSNSRVAYRKRVREFEPDIVVIYHATNDLASITRRAARAQGVWKSEQSSWLYRHSMLWSRLVVMAQISAQDSRDGRAAATISFDAKAAADAFAIRLGGLLDEVSPDGPITVIAVFAHRVDPDRGHGTDAYSPSVARQNMPYMRDADLARGYRALNETLRAVAGERSTLLVDDVERIPLSSEFFTDSFHFTDAGADRMADRVSAALTNSEAFLRLLERKQASSAPGGAPPVSCGPPAG